MKRKKRTNSKRLARREREERQKKDRLYDTKTTFFGQVKGLGGRRASQEMERIHHSNKS
jgi:hypothetical protein